MVFERILNRFLAAAKKLNNCSVLPHIIATSSH